MSKPIIVTLFFRSPIFGSFCKVRLIPKCGIIYAYIYFKSRSTEFFKKDKKTTINKSS